MISSLLYKIHRKKKHIFEKVNNKMVFYEFLKIVFQTSFKRTRTKQIIYFFMLFYSQKHK